MGWRRVDKQPPLIVGQHCWIYHPDGVTSVDPDCKIMQANWAGEHFFGNLYGWVNMRATHYMPIERPEPPED